MWLATTELRARTTRREEAIATGTKAARDEHRELVIEESRSKKAIDRADPLQIERAGRTQQLSCADLFAQLRSAETASATRSRARSADDIQSQWTRDVRLQPFRGSQRRERHHQRRRGSGAVNRRTSATQVAPA
jgi:hypothetical protein